MLKLNCCKFSKLIRQEPSVAILSLGFALIPAVASEGCYSCRTGAVDAGLYYPARASDDHKLIPRNRGAKNGIPGSRSIPQVDFA